MTPENKQQLTIEINKLIEKNNFKRALKIIQQNLKSGILADDVILLLRSANEIIRNGMLGKESFEEIGRNSTAICESIQTLISVIELEDLTKEFNPILKDDITHPILCIIPAETIGKHQLKAEFENYFKQLEFTDVEVTTWPASKPLHEYALVIFDNRHIPFNRSKGELDDKMKEKDPKLVNKTIQEMETCIAHKPKILMICIGEPFYLVSDHRNQITGANSLIPLHARILEALVFLKCFSSTNLKN